MSRPTSAVVSTLDAQAKGLLLWAQEQYEDGADPAAYPALRAALAAAEGLYDHARLLAPSAQIRGLGTGGDLPARITALREALRGR